MSKEKLYSRRVVVGWAARLPAVGAGAALLSGCDNNNTALCVDPEDLNFSEASIRKANNYIERSAQPDKQCVNCAFFQLPPAAGGVEPTCGNCEIFSGPANKDGYCDSWSARE